MSVSNERYSNLKAIDWFAVSAATSLSSPESQPSNGDYYVGDVLYCGDCKTPRRAVKNGYVVSIACDCRKVKREQTHAAERAATIAHNRKKAIPYVAWHDMTFENSDIELKQARNYVKNWNKAFRDNVGLLIIGNTGSGKTYMAAAIANALVNEGVRLLMANINDLAHEFTEEFGKNREALTAKLQYLDLLIIDDLGAEKQSEYGLFAVYDIINIRTESGKPMIITTNITADEFKNPSKSQYARIFSRISPLHKVFVAGEDRRKRKDPQKNKEIEDWLNG